MDPSPQYLNLWELAFHWVGLPAPLSPAEIPPKVQRTAAMLVQAVLMRQLPAYEAPLMRDTRSKDPRDEQLEMMEVCDVNDLHNAFIESRLDRTVLTQYWVATGEVFRWGLWHNVVLPSFVQPDPDDPDFASVGEPAQAARARPEAEDKKSCQEIALRKWKANSSIRIAEMARDDEVRRDGNGGLYEEATVCRWLREVAPLGIRGRKGRPSKKSSQKTDETAK
jgi:hypothetical protein